MGAYKPHPNYVPSENEWIGEIPATWHEMPFFVHAPPNKAPNKGMIESNLLSLSYGRIKRKNIDTAEGLLPASFETYQIVEKDDLVFRLTDLQNDLWSLRSAICVERGIITSAYLAVRPHNIEALYFSFLMRSYDLSKVFYGMGSGLRQSLKYSDMKRLPLLIPPKDEQKKIAAFLDYETAKIDALIEKQQQLIALLEEKRQAVISHAVTKGLNPDAPMRDSGIEWLGEVPDHWKVCRIKHVIGSDKNSMVDGPFGSSVNTDVDYVAIGVPVIRTVNITNKGFSAENLKHMRQGKFEQLRRHAVYPGDVLFSKVGTIGNSCILPDTIPEAILSTTGSCKISVDSSLYKAEFLVLCIQCMHTKLMEIANSNVQPFLNMANIKNLPLPQPSAQEQDLILSYIKTQVQRLDTVLNRAEDSASLLQERRTALVSAAVTGKIDVRNWKPPSSGSKPKTKKEVA